MKIRKNSKLNSIGVKVGILISVILFIVLGVKAVYDVSTSYSSAIKSNEATKLEETRNLSSKLEATFVSIYQSGYDTRTFVQKILESVPQEQRDRAYIEKAISDIVNHNDDIDGMGICFDTNAFDGKDANFVSEDSKSGKFSFYAFKNKDNVEMFRGDYTDQDWYTETMSENKILLLDPYLDTNNNLTASYCFPINYNSKPVGVIIVDTLVTDIQAYLAEKYSSPEDFKCLMTNTGTIVANSYDETKILQNFIELNPNSKQYFDAAQNGEESVLDEKSVTTGKHSKIIYIPVTTPGTKENWLFISATSFDYFTKDAKTSAIVSAVISVISILLVGGVIVAILLKTVVAPLALIESAVVKFSNYNLDLSDESEKAIKYMNRNDEVGSAIRAMGVLNENLTNIIANISAHSQNTAATAQQLTATAQSTSETAYEVAQAVTNIAEGATNQAEDTQSAAISVEKSNNLLGEMLEMLEKLTESTNIINARKNEGSKILNELMDITDETGKISEKVYEVINDTNKSTEAISVASEMIQSISDQTNLLALNAAIEAARAGEAGRGFAVVSEEIRKLAEDSAKFTNEIKLVIDELKGKSESAVQMMRTSSEMIKKQNEKVRETGDKFTEISAAVENSEELVTQIDKKASIISEENIKIVGVVENLSAIAEENAATTEEASASVDTQTQSIRDISNASENLAQIATELQSEMSKFNI